MKTTALPIFDSLADAAQSLHDACDNFLSLVGAEYISLYEESFVDGATDTVSFGGAAAFHHLMMIDEVTAEEFLDGDILAGANALNISVAELTGWMFAFDLLGNGNELRLATTILTNRRCPRGQFDTWELDNRNIERETRSFCKSLEGLISTLRGE